MPSVFSKIISKEIPGYIVAENEDFIAFLDINPLAIGHTLVVPKMEVDYIFDLPDDVLAGLHTFAKKVALAIERNVVCKRIGVSVIGLEVPHAHIHLVPIDSIKDLNFDRPKLQLSDREMIDLAKAICQSFTARD